VRFVIVIRPGTFGLEFDVNTSFDSPVTGGWQHHRQQFGVVKAVNELSPWMEGSTGGVGRPWLIVVRRRGCGTSDQGPVRRASIETA
jgi:hypothetical protein